MFTGIVTDRGVVLRIDDKGGQKRIVIGCHYDASDVEIGASVACDGCCLTVVDFEGGGIAFDVSNETLARTTIGNWKPETLVNIEKSMKLGDELGGHLVFGHVDAKAKLESIEKDGDCYLIKVSVPQQLAHYVAEKGSVALNGVSLTVTDVKDNIFGISIIPHTWEVTNLSRLKIGDEMNFEVDMLARYVARMLGKEASPMTAQE